MTPPLRDFVSTYRPPIQPEPFFGFLKEPEPRKRRKCGRYYRNKLARNKRDADRKPLIARRYNKYYDFTILYKTKPKRKAA